MGQPQVDTDITVQAFAQWLTEMRTRNASNLQQMLSEMAIIRDGITSNNTDLTEFKRHSTGISQQMQSQLTDLREKLTNAFGEITALVKQKTLSDQEMMQDINSLQGNLSCKTAEIENLKRSYSQAHQQLQSSLIQITNHMAVTKTEVATAASSCEQVRKDTSNRLDEIDNNLRGLEEMLSVGNAENRNQMVQLQEEIARIHESLVSVNTEFLDHKRATNSVHNKLQSQVWSLEEGRKRQQPFLQQGESQPITRVETTINSQPAGSYATQPATAGLAPAVATTTSLQSHETLPGLTMTTPSVDVAGGYPMVQPISQPAGSAQAATGPVRAAGTSALAPMDAATSVVADSQHRDVR